MGDSIFDLADEMGSIGGVDRRRWNARTIASSFASSSTLRIDALGQSEWASW